ncbi:hypothetical protein KVR01_005834 [Diaporthe batatas]|uniref:uncharacterized protein n=1 Tax=Diaporthe batatas TaxID=748121 RepID=UPI001D04D652|nr:uncharacterized protein KVR01_005834 [Diaporthe batatas]KAG8163916.1 hypothetical protein KVR01_005834 [Diaporthe batatas]
MSNFDLLYTWATYIVLLVLSCLPLLSVYRSFLHPLRRYPGPWLAKITDGYGGYNATRMRLHLAVKRDLDKYGPVYRQGPNRLVFNTATALKGLSNRAIQVVTGLALIATDIYNSERIGKSFVYTTLLKAKTSPNVFNVLDKQLHRSKRKVIGQAVTERAMRLFESTLQQQVDIFIEQLKSSKGPTDISPRCRYVGLDTIGLLAFGYDLNTQQNLEHRFVLDGLFAGNLKSNIIFQIPLLEALGINAVLSRLSGSSRVRFWGLLDKMTTSRLSMGKNARSDLVSFVAEGPQGAAMDDAQLRELLFSEGYFFVAAGGDTTAASLGALLFYLSREVNSEAYRKLADEIRTTFPSAEEIRSGPKLSGCHYLRACIDEALRMSPPIPGIAWRQQAAEDPQKGQPLIIDGHVIPPGTQLGVSAYALHHNEEYFPSPFSFQPERWLNAEKDAAQAAKMRSAFMPFSVGSRSCAGKAMAYLEASLVIAKTLWHFDFAAAPGELGRLGGGGPGKGFGRERPDEYQLYDIFASSHDGPCLVFTPRDQKK